MDRPLIRKTVTSGNIMDRPMFHKAPSRFGKLARFVVRSEHHPHQHSSITIARLLTRLNISNKKEGARMEGSGPISEFASKPRWIEKLPRWWFEKPEEGSLRSFILAHPREAVCVYGQSWNATVLEGIGCTVRPVKPEETLACKDGLEPTNFASHPDFDDIESDFEWFSELNTARERDILLRNIFPQLLRLAQEEGDEACEVSIPRGPLRLFYSSEPKDRLACPHLVTCEIQASVGVPVCAFIDKSWMRAVSKIHFGVRAYARKRREALGIQRPESSLGSQIVDPYYVAMLVAMGQEYYHKLRRLNRPVPDDPRHVYLFTLSPDRNCFVIYTAEITMQFLLKFEYPKTYFEDSELVVTREDIPFDTPLEIYRAMRKALTKAQEGLDIVDDTLPPLEFGGSTTEEASDIEEQVQLYGGLQAGYDLNAGFYGTPVPMTAAETQAPPTDPGDTNTQLHMQDDNEIYRLAEDDTDSGEASPILGTNFYGTTAAETQSDAGTQSSGDDAGQQELDAHSIEEMMRTGLRPPNVSTEYLDSLLPE
ncbi:hypothetical protein PVAG01_02023 [Phlyctema vagabunda]|uniref:Uncharacterized protein n=1 Tax=Phlyctema vagabunda TaxID=108571 RepID=A0ABR4PZ05_9HELO